VDPRLRLAVDASHGWYTDIFDLHGLPTTVEHGLWRSLGPPPPLHSAAKTLLPHVPPEAALRALDDLPHATIADSFGAFDLTPDGFVLLFEATWIHHPPLTSRPAPDGWSRVRDRDSLAAWVALHGTEGVFLPGILDRPAFALMARHDRDGLTGGFVVHQTAGAVMTSNGFAAPGATLGRAELVAVVAAWHPAREVVDYTYGDDLTDALAQGFTGLGPQRVWIR
jgi:hypothetical protein